MLMRGVLRTKRIVIPALGAFAFLVVSPVGNFARMQTLPQANGGGALVGFVYDEDMRSPVANAVVKLRNLMNGAEYASGPTDTSGMYAIKEVAAGKYLIGVTAKHKDFNFEYAVSLKDSEMAKLSVALKPASALEDPAGKAPRKPSFFTSPAGIVSLVVVAGAVIYALVEKPETSPVIR